MKGDNLFVYVCANRKLIDMLLFNFFFFLTMNVGAISCNCFDIFYGNEALSFMYERMNVELAVVQRGLN